MVLFQNNYTNLAFHTHTSKRLNERTYLIPYLISLHILTIPQTFTFLSIRIVTFLTPLPISLQSLALLTVLFYNKISYLTHPTSLFLPYL